MSLLNQRLWLTVLSMSLGLTLLTPPPPADARVKFVPPSGLGVPGRRVPGGSRGNDCISRGTPLTALVPQSNVGLTTSATPTVFFYLPRTSASMLELALRDSKTGTVYRNSYKTIAKSGVVGFRLPTQLAVGRSYKWSFSIVCNPSDRSLNTFVEGSIQRVSAPQLLKRINQAPVPERVALFAQAGIWQDCLTALAELRRDRPADAKLKADWEALLSGTGVGLDQIVRTQAPIVLVQDVSQSLVMNPSASVR
ncbi:DUF928 domain-containing protein [Leptolyngbya sp. FACHB-36]|uniref:DUF928 domain-containing protein n=1 Tax=Leptolyngbya sp. FACHB-36 TaxID=2692808 RepID=UPI001681AE2D|nr:DUF928 domain-containing protein [Leptolyngbya sp. FACHB-36]MBD2019730.1 DUF928 domain-containing protein [Leptolyngbya sp. FACHB-36]